MKFNVCTMYLLIQNRRFSQLLLETILDGVEKQRGIKVERKKTKRLRMQYKGMATPTVIRTRTGEVSKP